MTATVEERLQAALDALPDTADGIAAMLRAAGIKGERTCSTRCPLSIWLTAQVGMLICVEAFSVHTTFVVGARSGGLERVELPIPDAACVFVAEFDIDGRYQELSA